MDKPDAKQPLSTTAQHNEKYPNKKEAKQALRKNNISAQKWSEETNQQNKSAKSERKHNK